MKRTRNLLAALFLSLVLASSAFGGDIMTGVIGGTPPNQTTSSSAATTEGTAESPGAAAIAGDEQTSSLDPVTEAVLGLLQGLLSLF